MKVILHTEGSNDGAKFIKDYDGKIFDLESLYKDIDQNASPLAKLSIDKKIFTFQLVDVRFIEQNFFLYGFIMDDGANTGGKALLRFTPVI